MAYYNVCPRCGCNLDPNEKCDCEEERTQQITEWKKKETMMQAMYRTEPDGQMIMAV